MHHELAPAAQRQAVDRGDRRHEAVFQPLRGLLEERHHLLEVVELAGLEGLERRLEVGADREGRFVPDHQRVEVALGLVDGAVQPPGF